MPSSISNIKSSGIERWLECRLDKGMFSNEVAVTYPADGNSQKSVFVEKSSVQGNAGEKGKVRVRVIPGEIGNAMAVLPSANQDIVYIQERDISEE